MANEMNGLRDVIEGAMKKGYSAEDLTKSFIKFLNDLPSKEKQETTEEVSKEVMMQEITDVMHQIGIPAHIKGYHYVRSAIMRAIEDPFVISRVTKILYPSIAKEYGTTSSRVERAIRHAVESAWDRGNVDVLESYFGYTILSDRGKPTNSEFIAMIADKFRLKYKLG